eukprot:1157661-Pelagomonas_calceolata.AAC.4
MSCAGSEDVQTASSVDQCRVRSEDVQTASRSEDTQAASSGNQCVCAGSKDVHAASWGGCGTVIRAGPQDTLTASIGSKAESFVQILMSCRQQQRGMVAKLTHIDAESCVLLRFCRMQGRYKASKRDRGGAGPH